MLGKMSIAALISGVGLSLSAHAAVITSWENVDAAGGGAYDTVGVTDGNRSVKYDALAGFAYEIVLYQPIAPNTFLTAINATHKLYIDVSTTAMTGVSPAPAITDFHLTLQLIGSIADGFYHSPNFASQLGTGVNTGTTLVWDLPLGLPSSAALVFVKATVDENKTRTFYYDRLATTAVPEPATMGLIGLASLPALGRQQRRSA